MILRRRGRNVKGDFVFAVVTTEMPVLTLVIGRSESFVGKVFNMLVTECKP